MDRKVITAAAVQMEVGLGDVNANLDRAGRLVEEAFRRGAGLVILPEFFTSGMGFHRSLLRAALPFRGRVLNFLLDKARQHRAPVGGSYLAIKEDGERYNSFVLAFPDGKYCWHDKDLPTMWENCYYIGGSDGGLLDTPLGPVGAALCWEMIRTATVRRLRSKIDLLLAGSCWWTVPGRGLPLPKKALLGRLNLEMVRQAPVRMARLLGVPVVHAAHAGDFECSVPWLPGLRFRSHFLGETQIVDAGGKVLARLPREAGEGVVTAQIRIGRRDPLEELPDNYWLYDLHPLFKFFWNYQNRHGKRYYRRVTRRILL